MVAGSDEAGGLARGVVGSARTIAFGTSIVAPSASAATVLALVVAFAGLRLFVPAGVGLTSAFGS